MRRTLCSGLLYLIVTLSTHTVVAEDVRQKSTAKQRVVTGSGVILVEVEPSSGRVVHVRMLKSTGNRKLDEVAVNGFLKKRFKPGTPRRFEVPISYKLKVDE